MEGLTRFDIAAYGPHRMVVVESDLLPPDPAIVVIPLIEGYPAVPHLNPVIDVDGTPHVLATRLIAAVQRGRLKRVGSAATQGDAITRAVDVLMAGV